MSDAVRFIGPNCGNGTPLAIIQPSRETGHGPAEPGLEGGEMKYETKRSEDATHVIDDGGCLYWVAAQGMTSDQVAADFAATYDGGLGKYDVTTLATDERERYSA